MVQEVINPTVSLEDYVRSILEQHGFNDLSLEVQNELFADFMKQVLIRIGAGLSPLLSEKAKQKFEEMLSKEEESQEIWVEFWQKNIPNFKEVTKKILEDFALEIQHAFKTT